MTTEDPSPSEADPADRAPGTRRPSRPARARGGERPRRTTPGAETQRGRGPGAAAADELWQRYARARAADDAREIERARNALMERYLPLVRGAAERLQRTLPNSVELDDLVSAGLFGLMDAIRGFDASRGIKFATYCSSRVRGSILDQLRSEDWVPRLVRRRSAAVDRATDRLVSCFGREPNHMELAGELEVDPLQLSRDLVNGGVRSLHSLSGGSCEGGEEAGACHGDVLEDRRAESPALATAHRDMLDELTRSLSDRDRFIVTEYYEAGRTLREIGEVLNLTESRVCQIHANVMGHLRVRFGARQQTLLM